VNAVFERDFVRFSCSARFLWIRFGFAIAMGGLVFARVFQGYLAGDGNWSGIGNGVLLLAVVLGVGTIALMAPGAFGTVLVHARAQGSLPVLLSTPLTPLRIAGGAFAARCGLLLLFVMATWPPIALAMLFGGVRAEQVLEASASIIALLLVLGSPAFLVSAWARRTAGAVVASYLLAATVLAALFLAGEQLGKTDPWLAGAISPFHALVISTGPEPVTSPGLPSAPYTLLLWSIVLAGASVLLAAYRLRKEGLGDGDPTVPGVFRTRKTRPLRYENPVLDHELRAGTLGNSQSGARSLVILLVLTEAAFFGATYLGVSETDLYLHFGILGFQCLLLCLGATAAGATTLATEHETHVLDLLRVTPLTPAQIVLGKLLGLLRALLPCLVIPTGHLLYASFGLGVFGMLAAPAFVLTAAGVMTTWALAGMSQSLEQADPKRAVLRTMGLMGIFGVIVAAMIGVPVTGVFDDLDRYVAWTVGFGANPIGSMLLPAAMFRAAGSDVQTALVDPLSKRDIFTALIGGGFWIALHVAFAFAMYRRLFTTYRTRFDW